MGYYRGDYYRGDGNYYRGDPFIGSLIGRAAAKLGVGRVVARGARWVGQRITGQAVKKAVAAGAGVAATTAIATTVARRVGGEVELEDLEAPEGVMESGGGGGGGGVRWVRTASGRRMKVRWSYSQGKWIAVRHLNPLNPRALKRSLRRAEGFEKFARRTMNALFKTSDGRKVRKFRRKTTKG